MYKQDGQRFNEMMEKLNRPAPKITPPRDIPQRFDELEPDIDFWPAEPICTCLCHL
ncbi:hypothetical protein ACQR35_10900 [Pseudarthrobacter sp. J1738]|uniref:hypothetical protein n=1 Tax=Pseudarthrobacter sp. J1738 TaxID=3420446 RepID=UPI003D2E5910